MQSAVTSERPVRAPVPEGDPLHRRKARGAFFTPPEIARFMAQWAVRDPGDLVLEPSAGDAEFLVAAVERLQWLGGRPRPAVHGVEIHEHSAGVGRRRVVAAGGEPHIRVNDFFFVDPEPVYDVVLGNPPYIRYQDFSGEARARSRRAAFQSGVALSGLASSWAAFTVHSAAFLRPGGRLALVLPAELITVNYAAPVRRFLLERFARVELVFFDEQVFAEAETDVVLLLAEGFDDSGSSGASGLRVRRAARAATVATSSDGGFWAPEDRSGKWTGALIDGGASRVATRVAEQGLFTDLETWGDTTLGIVTGNNRYFALSPQRVAELGLRPDETILLSPPGSAHLRGLALSKELLAELGRRGKQTSLFVPRGKPSPAAASYIAQGHAEGVDEAYKCRVRKVWHQVPLVPPADLLLTCMNADTPRLTTNEAGACHLNSVHGVYLREDVRVLGRELLPLAGLNSVTLLSAELRGRSYGGGILKLEPKEADSWSVPSPTHVTERAAALRQIKPKVAESLARGRLAEAVELVDNVLLTAADLAPEELATVRAAREHLADRRAVRGASGR